MNTELYIARKIVPRRKDKTSISSPVVRFSIVAISLGVMIMIISLGIVHGFKKNIKEKVFGFGAHVHIVNFDSNSSYESVPIPVDSQLTESIASIDGVEHIQAFAIKAGIVKTKEHVQGIICKGIGDDYNWDFFKNYLQTGTLPDINENEKTNEVLISETLSEQLELSVGDRFLTSFVSKDNSGALRYRKFTISGVYQTHMEEFDSRFILCDIKQIQKLNNWSDTLISGYEILLSDYNKSEQLADQIWDKVGYGFLPDGSKLKVETIEEKYPQIFDWLSLLDMNVIVILTLIIVVAGLNMVSGLLVIILEKTNMIGIMKAVGAENLSIRKIFLYVGGFLISRGLLYGNIAGILLCLIQYFTHIIPLDEQTYFMPYVPVYISFVDILLVNIGSLIATMAMLVLPSMIISSIDPVKALRFD